MSARTAPVVLATLALLAVAGCAAAAPASTGPSFTPIAQAPRPTPIAVPTSSPDPSPTPDPTASPITGDVEGNTGGPELTVEDVSADTIKVTLQDPAAKAWRLVVSGTGDRAADRWEILVETGDVQPLITATEVRDDKVVDVMDLTGFGDGTAAAGGCHRTLGVCLDSDGFSLPADGNGTFSVRLTLQGATIAADGPRRDRGLAVRAVRARALDRHRRRSPGAARRGTRTPSAELTKPPSRRSREGASGASEAGGPGQNRTATAEGEGFTDPWAHHLPNRPTEWWR